MRLRILPVLLFFVAASVLALRASAASITYTLTSSTTDGGSVSGYLDYNPALAATGGTTGGTFTVDEPGTAGIPTGVYHVSFNTAGIQNGEQEALFYTSNYQYGLDLIFRINASGPPTLCVLYSCIIGPNGQSASVSTFYANQGPNYPGDTLGPGTFSSTPEPDSLALMGTGLVGVAAAMRRRLARG